MESRQASLPAGEDGVAMITMTKAEALEIQAKLVAIYAPLCANLAGRVAALTTAHKLEDDVAYDTDTINEHIPRGRVIEQICSTEFVGDLLVVARLTENKPL